MYIDEWKVIIGYFPEIDNMYRSIKKLNHSLSASFQAALISGKNYRDAHDIFKKLQKDFLTTKFGDNLGLHSLVVLAIETGNRRFAIELNRDLLILGEHEYPMILQRLGAKYKDFSQDCYQKCGFGNIANFRSSFHLMPGRYIIRNMHYTRRMFTVAIREIETTRKKLSAGFGQFLTKCRGFRNPLSGFWGSFLRFIETGFRNSLTA
jgi:hypothetical protein